MYHIKKAAAVGTSHSQQSLKFITTQMCNNYVSRGKEGGGIYG